MHEIKSRSETVISSVCGLVGFFVLSRGIMATNSFHLVWSKWRFCFGVSKIEIQNWKWNSKIDVHFFGANSVFFLIKILSIWFYIWDHKIDSHIDFECQISMRSNFTRSFPHIIPPRNHCALRIQNSFLEKLEFF